jgi:hypothetical protein
VKITSEDRLEDLTWPLPIEKKIDIFYKQLFGWQLHIADQIANGSPPLEEGARVNPIEHSGFAVLQICLSYFETIGKHRPTGSSVPAGKKSGSKFKAGVEAVFPTLSSIARKERGELLDAFYERARCALYHNSRTGRRVGLAQPSNGDAVYYDPKSRTLQISPERLPRVLKAHLEQYRGELLNPANGKLRASFQRRFDADFGVKP